MRRTATVLLLLFASSSAWSQAEASGAGLTTPGVQTEEGLKLQGVPYTMPGTGHVNPPTSGAKEAAPPNFDEAGQSEPEANTNAAAAARAEVTAGQGLGVQAGTAGPMSVGGQAAEGHGQAGTAAQVSAVGMSLTDGGFQPAQISVRRGEAVTLTNNTHRACGLRGDSISGILRPGQKYRHTFTQPGRYKFSCGETSGEITVR